MIDTIVFDFGNVIGFFDHSLTLARLAGHTDLPPETLRAAFYATDLEDAYEAGRVTTPVFLRRLRALGNLRCDEEYLAAAWSDIFRPNLDVCRLLPLLKSRHRLLLGSNTNELHSRQFRRQFAGPLSHFDALVLSHEIGVRKPHSPFFDHCRNLAGCRAEHCLFIDDLPVNVVGARDLGWQGILYHGIDDLVASLAALGILT